MITALLFVHLLAEPASTPGQALSKMIAKYNAATELVGEITMRQSAKGVTTTTKTEFQYASPSQLYISQVNNGSRGGTALVTSDGKKFTYDVPIGDYNRAKQRRLIESVTQGSKTFTYRDIYAISTACLLDRSPALDLVISRTEDLKYLRGQWVNLKFAKAGGEGEKYVIEGDYRPYGDAPIDGKFRITLSEKFDLVQYVVVEPVKVPNSAEVINVTTSWDVAIDSSKSPEPKRFRVVN